MKTWEIFLELAGIALIITAFLVPLAFMQIEESKLQHKEALACIEAKGNWGGRFCSFPEKERK